MTQALLPAPVAPDEELFLLEYVANGGNAVKAWLRTHPVITYDAARTAASRTLRRPHIQTRLALIREEARERAMVQVDDVVARLKAIAFSDLRDVVEWRGNTLTIKPSSEITPDAAATIDEIVMEDTQQGRRLKVKRADAKGALEDLAKMLGLFKTEVKHDHEHRWVMELPGEITEAEWRERYMQRLPAPKEGAAA